MQTPAFTNRPRTPWGQKVSPSVIGKNLTRIVGEQIYPDGIEMPERSMAPVLQIGRLSVRAEVDADWNAWYSGEYVPGYRRVPGVTYARRYRVLEGTSGYSTVYEFSGESLKSTACSRHRGSFRERGRVGASQLTAATGGRKRTGGFGCAMLNGDADTHRGDLVEANLVRMTHRLRRFANMR